MVNGSDILYLIHQVEAFEKINSWTKAPIGSHEVTFQGDPEMFFRGNFSIVK